MKMDLTEGKYFGRAVSAKVEELGSEKKVAVRVYLELEAETDAGSIEKVPFETLRWFTPKAIERSIEALETLGCTFPGGDVFNFMGLGEKRCKFTLKYETFNDKTELRVTGIWPVEPREQAEPSQDTKASIQEEAKALIMRRRGQVPEQASAAATAPKPAQHRTVTAKPKVPKVMPKDIAEEEIPF